MEYEKYLRYLKLFGYKYVNNISLKNELKFDNLDNLNTIIQNCSLCNLSNTTKYKNINNIKNVKVVFVIKKFYGLNEPFDVKEKEVFEKIISNVLNLTKNEFIILPIIKCSSIISVNIDSYNLCKNYILNELELINSKLVVTLGESFDTLFEDNFNNVKGNLIKYNNINIIPTYEIKYIMKNPTLKVDFYNDLKKIRFLLDKL